MSHPKYEGLHTPSEQLERLLQMRWLGIHCASPEDNYYCPILTLIQSHSPKVTPLTNSVKITIQGLCNCYSVNWRWHHSKQSVVISVTIRLVLSYTSIYLLFSSEEKIDKRYRGNSSWSKIPPWGTLGTISTRLLRQPSTATCWERLERNGVRTDSREPQMPTEQSLKRILKRSTLLKTALKSNWRQPMHSVKCGTDGHHKYRVLTYMRTGRVVSYLCFQ